MLMTAMHMDSTHAPSSSPTSPPWLPVLADHTHQLLYDLTASTPSPSPASAPPRHHLRHAAPATRRAAKRRPRPSRRLPTTYISADLASFRRMVHQVTGADDLPLPPPEVLHRPAPTRKALGPGTGALVLPTLDTSAFLLGTAGVPARAGALCDASAVLAPAPALEVEADGGGGPAYNSSAGNCGFPTLDSWDPLF
ncbi:calmodulin-binding protein 25-like [Phragmites australis]|uniref:calmodulin-binding protein 25-like n=1 Tax=Phragmites australis TaxID=29695 RepID=UPI002D794AA7|nr:calmodulin-binding protein 25-like [Phragmites australis]